MKNLKNDTAKTGKNGTEKGKKGYFQQMNQQIVSKSPMRNQQKHDHHIHCY